MLRMRTAGALAVATVAALGMWACDDVPTDTSTGSTVPGPSFHEQPIENILFMTGGGRIDCATTTPRPCPPEKNTPESHDFQTWGFNFGDKNGDGEITGQLQHVDHREEFRMGGDPRKYHSVSWDFFEPREPECEGAGGDGAAVAGGTIERKNDGSTWSFVVRADDCGEPGTKHPHDIYRLEVSDGYSVEGKLTGGNIQAHRKGNGNGSG